MPAQPETLLIISLGSFAAEPFDYFVLHGGVEAGITGVALATGAAA